MGAAYSMYTQTFPPAPKWGLNDIPNLSGRVAVVTGGYAGIGAETAKALLSHNVKVYIAGRDREKAARTIGALEAETGHKAIFLNLDLASLQSVKAAAAELASRETALHLLFNNAGVLAPPMDALTEEGYDLQWGTNVLGHFYFTQLVLPLLRAGAASSPDGKARIMNTASSAAENITIRVDPATFRDGPARRKQRPFALYAQSKIGNVLVSNELARRYGADGIVSVALNPGNLRTEMWRHRDATTLSSRMVNMILWPVEFGALTQLWAATSPEGLNMSGKFLWPWAREGCMPWTATGLELQAKIWEWCETQIQNL